MSQLLKQYDEVQTNLFEHIKVYAKRVYIQKKKKKMVINKYSYFGFTKKRTKTVNKAIILIAIVVRVLFLVGFIGII